MLTNTKSYFLAAVQFYHITIDTNMKRNWEQIERKKEKKKERKKAMSRKEKRREGRQERKKDI